MTECSNIVIRNLSFFGGCEFLLTESWNRNANRQLDKPKHCYVIGNNKWVEITDSEDLKMEPVVLYPQVL